MVLQECLEKRKRYVFSETIAPWEKEIISDPSTPKPNPAPFFYAPEGKSDVSLYFWLWYSILQLKNSVCNCVYIFIYFSLMNPFILQHYFEMQDGVIHVYPNKDCKNLKPSYLFVFSIECLPSHLNRGKRGKNEDE